MYIDIGGSLCRFYLIFLKYPMKMIQFGLIETKLFHFHRIFKKGGGGGGQGGRFTPLDLPLYRPGIQEIWRTHILYL